MNTNSEVRIMRKRCDRLSVDEYDWCYGNNFGQHGQMQGTFEWRCKHKADKTYVYLAILKDTNEFVGWSILCFTQYQRSPSSQAMFYVLPSYRRMKVGTKLSQRMKKDFGLYRIRSWDAVSRGFFQTVGLYTYQF